VAVKEEPVEGAAAKPSDQDAVTISEGAVANFSEGAAAKPSVHDAVTASEGEEANVSKGAVAKPSVQDAVTTSEGAAAKPSDEDVVTASEGVAANVSEGAAANVSEGAVAKPSDQDVVTASEGEAANIIEGAAANVNEGPVAKPSDQDVVTASEGEAAKPFYHDVVNVSEGFQLRTAYKKKVRPSRLDSLLERRVKQFTLEEKRRMERLKHNALLSKFSKVKTDGPDTQPPSPTDTATSTTTTPLHPKAEESPPLKDRKVVKRLEFDQVQVEGTTRTSGETDNLDVRLGSVVPAGGGTGPPAPSPPLKEVNGDAPLLEEEEEEEEEAEEMRVGENGRKRPLEEEEEEEEEEEVVEEEGVGGRAVVNGNDRPLVNGNGSQDAAPPPSKLPRLENHLEKGDGVDTATNNNPSPGDHAPPTDHTLKTVSQVTTTMVTMVTTTSQTAVSGNGTAAAVARSTAQCTTITTTACSVTTATGRTRESRAVTSRSTSSMTVSKEYSTRDRVNLLRFSKCRKARSGTALPSYRKFVTKSSKKSIFVLPNDQLQRLARRAGIREVPIFSYNAKPAPDIWPYPSPRPTFAITWRSVTEEGGSEVLKTCGGLFGG